MAILLEQNTTTTSVTGSLRTLKELSVNIFDSHVKSFVFDTTRSDFWESGEPFSAFKLHTLQDSFKRKDKL